MSNGHNKNFVRLYIAIAGFRSRYNRWPTRVRLFPGTLDNLRSLFTKEDFDKLTSKVKLVPDEAPFVAEDEDGNSYSYGAERMPKGYSDIHPAVWLGVRPINRN
jgi:hypothetical protein